MEHQPAPSWASSPSVRRIMQGNTRRDTRPELAVRRETHRRGMRYRVDAAPLPGLRRRADLVFSGPRIAVFIDGCFWHACPEHFVPPKTKADYWAQKLQANQERDRDTDRLLTDAGWLPLRFWAHENPTAIADAIERAVGASSPPHGRRHDRASAFASGARVMPPG